MAEPGGPSIPVSPFDPTPSGPRPATRSGCPKPLLIGCLALTVLAGISLVAFIVLAPRLMPRLLEWSLSTLETQIYAQWPADATPEDRARLERAFDDARAALGDAEVFKTEAGQVKLQQLQSAVMGLSRKQRYTRADIVELTTALEEIGGGAGAEPSEAEPGADDMEDVEEVPQAPDLDANPPPEP